MDVPTLNVPEFLRRNAAAIARADLMANLRRCRFVIDLLKRRHRDELNRAAIDLANAHDALVAFIEKAPLSPGQRRALR